MKDKKIKPDRRFSIANREAIIGCLLAAFNILWWYGFAYGMGSKSPEEYTYIFGFPAWFFYSCIVGFIVMAVLVAVVVKFVLKEMPFTDDGEEDEVDSV
ncbi:YhdT family protein [Virgibacillus oceani]|uniref:Sodium:pantothenate symporter n=1 Tax=Virgibacillus oceani TaxID=1479511 RepID=A0A917M8J7_9BACI|nr:YhdT family protein [Virgibacillus oceani]GGG84407.1 sodium:pantothenate symporter [Virgibacillus oceani]